MTSKLPILCFIYPLLLQSNFVFSSSIRKGMTSALYSNHRSTGVRHISLNVVGRVVAGRSQASA
jgi:hypothetical protein